MTDRQEIFGRCHESLTELEEQLARVEEAWGRSKGEARQKLEQELEELRAQRDALSTRLEALKHGSESAWDEGLAAFRRASDELGKGLERARAKFGT